eukprot:517297-Alexandrium_andersonii.AAC.1
MLQWGGEGGVRWISHRPAARAGSRRVPLEGREGPPRAPGHRAREVGRLRRWDQEGRQRAAPR